MTSVDNSFSKRVCQVVASIPSGRVMTYGQIAAICGNARASRIVGGIAHFGDPSLPWHRIVNIKGKLADGYPGGVIQQKQLLEQDGLSIDSREGGYFVSLTAGNLWSPDI